MPGAAAYKAERVKLARALVDELMQDLACSKCQRPDGLRLRHPSDGPKSAGKTIREMVKSGYALDSVRNAVAECIPICLVCLETEGVEDSLCPHCGQTMPGVKPKLKDTTKVEAVVEELRSKAAELDQRKEAAEAATPVMGVLSRAAAERAAESAIPPEERMEKYEAAMKETMGEQIAVNHMDRMASMTDYDLEMWLRNNQQSRASPHVKWTVALYESRGLTLPKGVLL